MAQAKRIRKQPSKKAKRKSAAGSQFPWGLVLVVLVCGVVIGMLFNGAMNHESGFGSGLRSLMERQAQPSKEDKEIKALIAKQPAEKEFDFYELLPEIEKVMPDLPDADPVRPDPNIDYYLQAASFRVQSDAEKLRARLALKGFKSVTQAREVEGKGTYYRVRMGPFPDKRKAKTQKNKLQKLGVNPFIYTVKKS